jgi:D-alanyl-D-alanine carboxypeptidase/D-alanyl-D-alanine-endopeptidase (penicillin-binding protein 4)
MKKYLILLVILSLSIGSWAQDSLRIRLDSLLDNSLFQTSLVGLMVYDLTGDSVYYTHNYRQMMRPASTMKLVTAITALDRLGSDYEYQTRIYYSGTVTNGTLKGNIYCVGGFDPTLTRDDIAVMAESVRSMGVDSISGSIVADRQMKDALDYGEGWCWDDDNPMLMPLSVGRKDIFLKTFSEELMRQGIRMRGVQLQQRGQMPSNARRISVYRHNINVVLERMMKVSDNFYAESMFYQTAASTGHRPAKAADAAGITKQLIKKIGLGSKPYRIADGSGLSLYNYVSPELLVGLLRYAYRKPAIYNCLLPALPVAGVDGTLKSRMIGTSACGNVCAKTGTVTGVSALAGYLTTADGRQFCFAIINQGIMRTSDGRDFQDRVCKALCDPIQIAEDTVE